MPEITQTSQVQKYVPATTTIAIHIADRTRMNDVFICVFSTSYTQEARKGLEFNNLLLFAGMTRHTYLFYVRSGTPVRPIVQFNIKGKSLCQITAIRSGGLEKMRAHALELRTSLENGEVEVNKKTCYEKVDRIIAAAADS